MKNSNVTVPRRKADLLYELGKIMLEQTFAQQGYTGAELKAAVSSIARRECLVTANGWLRRNRRQLSVLKTLCERAKRDPKPRAILDNDIRDNVDNCATILDELQPSYVAEVFRTGVAEGASARFLTMFTQLA